MKYALVTGASSGLGVEFAKLFAAQGISLILTSSPRSKSDLEKVALDVGQINKIDVLTYSCDLSGVNGATDLYQWINEQGLTVEYLVNNAGFGICGQKVQDYDRQTFKDMLQVNINALSELVSYFVPPMVERGSGKILNISSIVGYVYPHGLEAAYSASKAYVVSLSEGMHDDLRGTGVTCTHLAPGPTRTKFFATAGLKNDSKVAKLYMSPEVVA